MPLTAMSAVAPKSEVARGGRFFAFLVLPGFNGKTITTQSIYSLSGGSARESSS